MKKYILAASVIPAIVAMPLVVHINEVEAAATIPEYHLHNDVRTITFSQNIDPSTLSGITLVDEITNTELQIVAEIGDNPKQVKIVLDTNEHYTNRHTYKLNLKGIKSINNRTMKETSKKFQMVEKAPEQINFKQSYIVQNTTNDPQSIELPAGASYISYDQYGAADQFDPNAVNTATTTKVKVDPKERLTVSFLDNTTLNEQSGFSIIPTANAAYTVYSLNKYNSLKITGQDENSIVNIYYGNPTENTVASYAKYNAQNEAVDFKHDQQVKAGFTNVNLNPKYEAVITNEDYEQLYVFAPKTSYVLTTVEHSKEAAVTAHTLKRYEKLQANSTEPTYNTSLKYDVSEGEWKISAVTYQEGEVDNTIFGEQRAAVVDTKGDTIIKNEIGLPITVSGPGRYVTFTETEEEPLAFYNLKQGDKVNISATTVDEYPMFLRDLSKKGMYSNINLYDGIVNTANLNKLVATFGDDSFVVGGKFTNIIENTSSEPLQLYGAARTTKFEKQSTALFTTFTLLPNEQVNVESTKETKLYLKDDQVQGKYFIIQNGIENNVNFEFAATNRVLLDNNETVTIKNTGNTEITLFAKTGEVKYVK